MNQDFQSLDYSFLKYIGVSPDGEATLHEFYLQFLNGKHRVLDLGCGFGGFVNLMRISGIDAVGVDSDPLCIAETKKLNIPVIEADVIDYLRSVEPESLDSIVAAHLVEHLPYTLVLEMAQLAYRALAHGGVLLLITPNPRALVSHLELYPLHFGHVAMYHPTLLTFFMDFAGFTHTEVGENPLTRTAMVAGQSPLVQLQDIAESAAGLGRQLNPEDIIPKPSGLFHQALWQVRTSLIRWLVQPNFDQTSDQFRQTGQLISSTIQTLDRPFECYAIGYKD